jgi:hypothetical protein
MTKTKFTFDIAIGVEEEPEQIREHGYSPVEADNGKIYCPLGEIRASAIVEDDDEDEARRKAIRTGCYFFKQQHPEWEGELLHGLEADLVRRSLVR